MATTETKMDNIEEQKQSTHKSLIEQIDNHLRIYYQQHGINDYYDEDNEAGKFKIWCEENEYQTDALIEEFDGEVNDACFIDFDPDFPFTNPIKDKDKKLLKIFKYIKNLYEDKEEIHLDDFDLYVSVAQMRQTREIYQQHVKTWGSEDGFTQLTDINILYMLTVSRIYKNQNLLLNVIDSCKRDFIAQQVHIKKENKNKLPDTDIIDTPMTPENDRLKQWISKRLFLTELDKAIKKIANRWDVNELKTIHFEKKTDNERTNLDLKMIVDTYPKRMGQRLSPMGSRLMNSNLQMVAKYIVASSKFLSQIIEFETRGIGGPAFQFDFIILLKPSVSGDIFKKADHRPANTNDEMSDDDDDDVDYKGTDNKIAKYEYKEDIIPNPLNDIKLCNCKFDQSYIEQEVKNEEWFEIVARKNMVSAFRELKSKLSDVNKKTYPRKERFNMIIDGRKGINDENENENENESNKDQLIVFQPPTGCNKLSNINIAECYFDLSRQCLIPRKGYIPWDKRTTDDKINLANADKEQTEKLKTQTIDATQAAQGQILTFSYHVWAADEIKCYLLWNGRCHRFYPQDILELLPHLFVKSDANNEFVKSEEAKRLVMECKKEITDTKFEKFYRGLNRLHKYEFPKQYFVPDRKFAMEQPPQ